MALDLELRAAEAAFDRGEWGAGLALLWAAIEELADTEGGEG